MLDMSADNINSKDNVDYEVLDIIAMLHLLQYIVKRVLTTCTTCFKSLKPIQTGLRMLMSLNIHLHSLHLDTQYGQT